MRSPGRQTGVWRTPILKGMQTQRRQEAMHGQSSAIRLPLDSKSLGVSTKCNAEEGRFAWKELHTRCMWRACSLTTTSPPPAAPGTACMREGECA
eukprot:10391388-Karenia_brevis.AAC.1